MTDKIDKYSTTINWSDADNSFVALVPEFPGLSAFGDTKQEALKEAETVLIDMIKIMEDDKEKLPNPIKIGEHHSESYGQTVYNNKD